MSLFAKKPRNSSEISRFFVPLQSKIIKMAKKKILFINQEIAPYVPDSHMSIMGRDLSQAIQEIGHEIRTFMPKWGMINERRGQLHEVIRLSGMNLIIDDTDHPLIIKVASIQSAKIQVYFIDNDDYFNKRQMGQDENGKDYPDNGERAIFYARGVLETVKKLRWIPDIIHCQGWMSALVPYYIKKAYHDEPSFAETKVVSSLFTNGLTSTLEPDFKRFTEFREATSDLLAPYKDIMDFDELSKLVIDYSDGVVEAEEGVNADLLKYATEKNIPLLKYNKDDFAQSCEDFYNMIAPDKEEEAEDF